jgi:peptidoglycan-N-acetylglucosamine deacetylase
MAMRLLAMACAAAIVFCVTAFAAIMAQQRPNPPAPGPAPTAATAAQPLAAQVHAAADPIKPAEHYASASGPGVIETTGNGVTASEPSAVVVAQAAPRAAQPTPAQPAAAPPPPPSSMNAACAGNPNALGVARVVEIDTTGGPGFGFEHFKTHDFLREGEVVLTFDDGPWPKNTPAVLAALQAHCTKAIFFPIGIHATWEPAILKKVAEAGHAIGSHTWCHQDLSKTKGHCRIDG